MHPALHTKLCELTGVRYPIVQTGMGWVASASLVSATANAGGLGIIASATMDLLRPGINHAIDEYASFPEMLSRVKIERSAFPDDINVIGAAATWLNAHRIPATHSGK